MRRTCGRSQFREEAVDDPLWWLANWEATVRIEGNEPLTFKGKVRLSAYQSEIFSTDLYSQLMGYSRPEIQTDVVFFAQLPSRRRRIASRAETALMPDFPFVAERYTRLMEREALDQLQKERKALYIYASLAIVILVMLLLLLRLIFRGITRFLDRAKAKVVPFMQNRSQAKEKRRIRQIIIDEMVRQSTRNKVSDAHPEDKARIRQRIKDALDRGDTETAKVLMSLLDQVDSNKTT